VQGTWTVLGEVSVPALPAVLAASTADTLQGTVAQPVADVRVFVSDQFGDGAPGVAIEYVVELGSGSLTPANGQVETAVDGTAAVGWVLGTAAGQYNNVLRATTAGMTDTVRFVASAAAGMPATVVMSSPDVMLKGTGATHDLDYVVEDEFGNVLTPAAASWASTMPAVATVNAEGIVSAVAGGQSIVLVDLGGVSGSALVTVSAPAPPVTVWSTRQGGSNQWGAHPEAVWACGADEMSFFDGAVWQTQGIPAGFTCRELWGSSDHDVYAVGLGGRILHYDGSQWEELVSPTGEDLVSVWGSAPDNVLVSGNAGQVWRFDGTTWMPEATGAQDQVRDLWGFHGASLFAAVPTGELLRYGNDGWTTDAAVQARAVWGLAPDSVLAIGAAGAIWWFDGTTWHPEALPTTADLYDVTGSGASDVYVTSTNGELWYYDGSAWTLVQGLGTGTLFDAAAVPGGDVYVSGFRGHRGATVHALTPDTIMTAVGDTFTVRVEARDAEGAPITDPVAYSWTSTLPGAGTFADGVATVDPNTGLVTAMGPGQAVITATAPGGAQDSALVTVEVATWTWVSGSSSWDQQGTYGTKGAPSAANVPGARTDAAAWTDGGGDLWLHGGTGYDAVGSKGVLNDLWRFDGTNWTWLSGSTGNGALGVYGTRGVAAAANVPGAREGAVSWIDAGGNLWLFGGSGVDGVGASGFLNDLWRFDGSNWTWMSGSTTAGQAGVYGTKGATDTANVPGARANGVAWLDDGDNLAVRRNGLDVDHWERLRRAVGFVR
jgi:hypothetical protein